MPRIITKTVCLALLLSSLSACTNNPFAWKLLYGQFDNFLSKQLIGYADFTDAQEELIRSEVDKTVLWHRQNELPKYADLIAEFQVRFLSKEPRPTKIDMTWLVDEANDVGLRFDQKSPLLALLPMLAKLNETQVEQIAETIDEEFEDAKKEWEAEADQDPAIASEKSMRKFLKRLGLTTNRQQQGALIASLRLRQLNRESQEPIWREWSDELISILNSRSKPNFAQRFTDHHFARIDLLERKQPIKWAHDQALFKNMFLNLMVSLDSKQKKSMNQKLNKFKEVALELSRSE